MEDDVVGALTADAAFQDWQRDFLDHPQTGDLVANGHKGAAARGVYESDLTASEEKLLELSQGLNSDGQRSLFAARADQHRRLAENRVTAHEAGEGDRHRRTTLAAHSARETDRAVDLTFEQAIKKYREKKFEGESLLAEIRKSAFRIRKSIDDKYGTK